MPQRVRLSIVLKVAILAGSIAALSSMVAGSLIVQGASDIIYKNALSQLEHNARTSTANLLVEIKNLRSNVSYLAGTPPIQGIPRAIQNNGIDPLDNSNLEVWKQRLATIFSEFIRAKPNYLQIRYIGINDKGKELVRVNQLGNQVRIESTNKLQSKSHQPYFKKAINLQPGEIYLSEINLNREHGKISEPHIPSIRAATPVFHQDKLFGIIVINMSFDKLIDDFITQTPKEQIPYITNEQGYYLAHLDKSQTFGFELGHSSMIKDTYQEFELADNKDFRKNSFTLQSNDTVVHIEKARFDPMNNERYFAVITATNEKYFKNLSDPLKRTAFLIMTALVMGSILLSIVFARKLMAPLKLIAIASENFARGRDIAQLPVDGRDEIGELARSFTHMYQQLEEKEREIIINQGRLHHANKLASLGDMASGMAHEINSPVQAITLLAQRTQRILKTKKDDQEIDELMDKICKSANNISNIIDSLRKTSRTSTNEDYMQTRISDLIQDVESMTKLRFKSSNVKYHITYHDLMENTLIQCQRFQISQVLINLINNAYDAIQNNYEKWIRVDIEKDENIVIFSITDSGAKIPHDIKHKMFEPMFTTKEIGEGTGLGLSISREIILNHNGNLFLDEYSSNTKFVIKIPIVHV